MKRFQDAEGREWCLDLSIGTMKRVKALLGVDLLAPHDRPQPAADAQTRRGPPLVTRLHNDLVLLVDVIYVAVKDQADSRGVSDEQFAAAMRGDGAYNAYAAFMEEWADFFQRLRRPDAAKVVRTHVRMVEAEAVKSETLIDRAADAVGRRLDERRRRLEARLAADGPGATFTSGPAS